MVKTVLIISICVLMAGCLPTPSPKVFCDKTSNGYFVCSIKCDGYVYSWDVKYRHPILPDGHLGETEISN